METATTETGLITTTMITSALIIKKERPQEDSLIFPTHSSKYLN